MRQQITYDKIIVTSAKLMEFELRLYPIPSNVVLNKVLTGWGATYGEIKADRNSIIILPHKSQIYSKHEKHRLEDNTFPVTEAMKVNDIKKYIRSSGDRNIKFLCTPEGLKKLISAILQTHQNPFEDYFILLDEWHKLTMDIGYRVNISMVMDDFFSFKGKAMVSSTPFMPSDPRFQHFEFWRVEHKEVKKDLTLYSVNNLASAFKDYIDNCDGKQLFIFFNTLNGIQSLIQNNDLEVSSSIYCSQDGVRDFYLKGMSNAYSIIDNTTLSRFNFLTSSFFNGLDISGLDHLPDILILTDTHYANHSIIDPTTEAYQILGRFRKKINEQKLTYRSAVHMVNTRHKPICKHHNELINDYEQSKAKYELLQDLKATAVNDFLRDDVFEQAIQRIKPYYSLLNEYGDLDYFKYDNYIEDNNIKEMYYSFDNLQVAYVKSNLFNITAKTKLFLPEEFKKMSMSMKRYSKENIKRLCSQLTHLELDGNVDGVSAVYRDLYKRFPLVVRAYDLLGIDKMEALKYAINPIRAALLKVDIANGKNHQGMIDAVYLDFRIGLSYAVKDVKLKLQKIFDEYEIVTTAKSTDIKVYFEVNEYTAHKPHSIRMYKLLARKFNYLNPNSNRELHNI